jgi:hypothetical protein
MIKVEKGKGKKYMMMMMVKEQRNQEHQSKRRKDDSHLELNILLRIKNLFVFFSSLLLSFSLSI